MKKLTHIITFGLFSALLLIPGSALSADQRYRHDPDRADRICVFSDTNYRGQSACLYIGQSMANLKTVGWNDKISSIRVYGRARLIAFQDTNFRGRTIDVSYDIPNLKAEGWNDRISALQVVSVRGYRDDWRRDDRYRGDRDDQWRRDDDPWRRNDDGWYPNDRRQRGDEGWPY